MRCTVRSVLALFVAMTLAAASASAQGQPSSRPAQGSDVFVDPTPAEQTIQPPSVTPIIPEGYAAAAPPPAPSGTASSATADASTLAQRWMLFNALSKSIGVAIVLEIFLPGVGNLYAENLTGSLVTWGAFVLAVALAFPDTSCDPYDDPVCGDAPVTLPLAVFLVIGGYVYGIVSAAQAVTRYNDRLAVRLGLQGQTIGFGPGGLTIRF
ncbi:MAG: hypothetical protein RMK74_10260 [Myxococcales bacterium]|nr:hypothetical protein [Myxococcales bacterium]